MKFQIAIVGLGQIGASVGLALAKHTELIRRVGYDLDQDITRRALAMGAVDEVFPYLDEGLRDADLILLALPMDQIYNVMTQIAPIMKDDALLIDTAPIKEVVAHWVREILGDECNYVGLTPVINPKYLHGSTYGFEAAHEDLFWDGMMAISSHPRCDPNAIKLAADLTRLIGATPLFIDLVEIDGKMTATNIIPQLLGAALVNVATEQPGWRQASKLAGRAYAEVSGPIAFGSPGALSTTAMLNSENVLRVLDSVIASLQNLREDIERQDNQALSQRLERARFAREQWWQERQDSSLVPDELPKAKPSEASNIFGDLLRFGQIPKTDRE